MAQLDKDAGVGTSRSEMTSQDDDDDDDDSTYEDEDEDAGGSLMGDQDQRSIGTSSHHSFMTSDQSIKRRFLAETGQAAKTLEQDRRRTASGGDDSNNSSEPPSLEDLCVHVKTMSAVLKRQAFRLQHRLGENSNDPSAGKEDDCHFKQRQQRAAHSTNKKGMPKGHKALLREVERLFVECNETLEDAFERLEEVGDERRHSHFTASGIGRTSRRQQQQQQLKLQEYRKTFTLEKASIDRLRRSFIKSLQSTSTGGPSSSSSSSLSGGGGGGGSGGGGMDVSVSVKNLDRLSSSTMNTSSTQPISSSFASLMTTSTTGGSSIPSNHRIDLDDSHKLSVVLEGAEKSV